MTTHTSTETEEPTFYNTMYEYARDADITHYRMSGDGEDEYRIEAFNPADDTDFVIDNDHTITTGQCYIPVCWGEGEPSALLESEITTGQCYIVYRWDDPEQLYVSDGSVYETWAAANLVVIIANLPDTQYYCEKCQQIFEYRYPEQHGCEQCNAAIGDDNVAGRD